MGVLRTLCPSDHTVMFKLPDLELAPFLNLPFSCIPCDCCSPFPAACISPILHWREVSSSGIHSALLGTALCDFWLIKPLIILTFQLRENCTNGVMHQHRHCLSPCQIQGCFIFFLLSLAFVNWCSDLHMLCCMLLCKSLIKQCNTIEN